MDEEDFPYGDGEVTYTGRAVAAEFAYKEEYPQAVIVARQSEEDTHICCRVRNVGWDEKYSIYVEDSNAVEAGLKVCLGDMVDVLSGEKES